MKTLPMITGGLGLAVAALLATFNMADEKTGVDSVPVAASQETEEGTKATPDDPATEQKILKDSAFVTEHYEEIGQYWMKLLDDDKALNKRRAYAAKVLGQVRYLPAIPVLIKHIRFMEFTGDVYSDGEDGLVVQQALGKYGNAAVPAIIDAYLDDPDDRKRSALKNTIYSGETQKVAMTYLYGLQAQHDKRLTDDQVQYFRERFGK